MKKYNSRIGKIFQWTDYIRSRKDKRTGEIRYDQSTVELPGYNQRYIGAYLSHLGKLYIAVAVNKKKDSGTWWKYIIENRIQSLIRNGDNMSPKDRGVTVVPITYLELLYKDSFTYNNLYGPIEPTQLDIVVQSLKAELNKEIDACYDNVKAASDSSN